MRWTWLLRRRHAAYGARAGACNRAPPLLLAALLFALPLTAARAQEVTIAALGDSLTQGYGLREADGFVPQLETWLEANGAGDVEIINAGVSGDTTAGGLARVEWTLTPEVDAVIVELGGNDLLRGLDPAAIRGNLDGILAAVRAKDLPVLLAGLRAPGNYGPEYQTAYDAMFPDLAETHEAILYESFLSAIAEGRDLDAARAFMQRDGIHPNAEGVALIVEDIGPAVLDLIAAAREAAS